MRGTKLISTKDLSREDWLKVRKQGIGGSEIGALMGVNKWKSPIKIYLDKLNIGEDNFHSESAYWGIQLEDLVAQELVKRLADEAFPITAKINRVNFVIQDPDHPIALANIDREIKTDVDEGYGILEVKTANQYSMDEWERDDIPESYMCQLQWYMGICGASWGYFAVLIGGQKFWYKKIEFNQALFDEMIRVAEDFWTNNIEAGIPPMANGYAREEAADIALLNSFTGNLEGRIVDIYEPVGAEKEQLEAELYERFLMDSYIKVLETEKDRITNLIRLHVKEAEKAVIGEWKVSNKSKFLITKPKHLSGTEFSLEGTQQAITKKLINCKF